jgi:hypothetical protein
MTPEAIELRKELLANQDERIKVFQLGMTLLLAIETALYYIRRDVLDHLIADAVRLNHTAPGSLPTHNFAAGNFILWGVAAIFSAITIAISQRNQFLRDQYAKYCKDDLPLCPRIQWVRFIVIICYVAVPIMDIVVRIIVTGSVTANRV